MRLGDLPGQGVRAAAHEAGVAGGVVGGAEGALGEQARGRHGAGNGVDPRGLQRLLEGHVRQDGRHAPGHQRLAGAGTADKKHIVGRYQV